MKDKIWFKLKDNRPPQDIKVDIVMKDMKESKAILVYDPKQNISMWKVDNLMLSYDNVLFWSQISPSMMRDSYEHR